MLLCAIGSLITWCYLVLCLIKCTKSVQAAFQFNNSCYPQEIKIFCTVNFWDLTSIFDMCMQLQLTRVNAIVLYKSSKWVGKVTVDAAARSGRALILPFGQLVCVKSAGRLNVFHCLRTGLAQDFNIRCGPVWQ